MSFSRRLSARVGCGVFASFLILCLIAGIIGMFCWPYAINSWLVFAGKPPNIQWYQGFLLGIIPIFGKFSLVFAVLTWIILMFL